MKLIVGQMSLCKSDWRVALVCLFGTGNSALPLPVFAKILDLLFYLEKAFLPSWVPRGAKIAARVKRSQFMKVFMAGPASTWSTLSK